MPFRRTRLAPHSNQADATYWHLEKGDGKAVCGIRVRFVLRTTYDRAVDCPDCLIALVREAAPNWSIEDVLKRD